MSNSTTMTYGNYSFSPVPLMTIGKRLNRRGDNKVVGATKAIRLEGVLTPLPTGDGSYDVIDDMQDELEDAFSEEGKVFEVKCDSSTLLSVRPRINNLEFQASNNNWVTTSPYTINMEYDVAFTGISEFIEDFNETWNLEFNNDNRYYNIDLSTVDASHRDGSTYYETDESPISVLITHTISAKGKVNYSGASTTVLEPWEHARDYVLQAGNLGFDDTVVEQSGVLNFSTSDFTPYDHFRIVEQDETEGTYSVTETWTATNPSGSGVVTGDAIEDFTINVNKSIDNGLTTVSINGNIKGLELRNYGSDPADFSISRAAFTSAQNYWQKVQSRLLSRAQYAGQSTATRTINPVALSEVYAFNPTKGIVTYNYEYDDRPCNIVSGSLQENITVNDVHPTDVFAAITVLGRNAGPILQTINTVTQRSRDVNIEVIMEPPSGCTVSDMLDNKPSTEVESVLCDFEDDLTSNYDQVFKSSDNESWNPKTGAYSRQVSWVFQACTGSGDTSFC